MNEQAIQDSYNLFVQQGYKDSIDDFKKLIATNPEALNDSYGFFKSQGYNESIEDYKNLMGIGAQPTLKKKEPTTTVSPLAGTSSGLSSEQNLNPFAKNIVGIPQPEPTAPIEEAISPTKKVAASPKFNDKLNTIDSKLINNNEEYVVPQLNYQFGDLGFKFEESGATGDFMTVRAPNGKKLEISLDPFMDATAVSESIKLKQFIKENTSNKGLSVIEREAAEENKKFKTQKEVDYSIKKVADEANNLNISLKDFIAKKDAFDKMPQGTQEYNRLQAELEAERDNLIQKQKNLEVKQTTLQKSVGKYTAMKEQQGTWLGGTWNAFLGGSSSITAGMTDMFTDIMSEILPNEMQMSPEDLKKNSTEIAKRLGVKPQAENQTYAQWKSTLTERQSDALEDKLDDIAKKNVKKEVIPAVRKGNVGVYGSSTTTPEWEKLKSKGFWGGAYLGVIKSLPAIIGGAGWGGAIQRTAQMYAQVSDGIREEMDANPEFANISENEKLSVVLPIGIVGAVLEEAGLRNIKASKGLINKIMMSALGKAGVNTTAKGFRELVENEVESRLAKGLLVLGAAGLAEAETGAAQQATEYGIKDIYNSVKGKKMFDTPDTAGEWIKDVAIAGAQEAVGGFMLGVPTAVSAAYSKKGFLNMDDNTFKVFESAANDENIQKAFITNLKTQITQGVITTADAKEQLNNYRNSIGLFKALPEGLNTQQKKEAMNLLKEKRDLENQIDGKDQSLVKKLKERVTEIDLSLEGISETAATEKVKEENNRKEFDALPQQEKIKFLTSETLKSIDKIANIDNVSSEVYDNILLSFAYQDFVKQKELTNRIAEIESTLSPDAETQVSNKEKSKLEKELETLKTKQNAIQEPSTDESLLRGEQPEVGLQEVGKGNAQPEGPTAGTTEVINAQPQEEVAPELTQQQRDIQRDKLDEEVFRAKKRIASAADTEAAIEEYNAAKKTLADFDAAEEQRKDKNRAKTNVATIIEDEAVTAQRAGYEYKDLYEEDPRLAAIQGAKDMVQFAESGDLANAYVEQGLSKKEAKAKAENSIKTSQQDILDLETDIQENPIVSSKTPEQEVTELEGLFGEQMKQFAPVTETNVAEEGQTPYFKNNTTLRESYIKEKINEAFDNMPFKKFISLFRKHINPNFTRENNLKSNGGVVTKNFSFQEHAGYVIGDGSYGVTEEQFRAFAKDAGIDIPTPQTNVAEEGQTPYQSKLSADKTARNMGMDDKGFFPKGDPASIKKAMAPYGYGVKTASNGNYYLTGPNGRFTMPSKTTPAQAPTAATTQAPTATTTETPTATTTETPTATTTETPKATGPATQLSMVFEPADGLPYKSEVKGNYPIEDKNVKEGDVKTLEEVWSEVKDIKFSGDTKIKSHADVAFIMKTLESKGVEHAFAVHIDESGTPHIQFLGIGGVTAAVVDARIVTTGAKRYKAKTTYLIHNHPSGNLKPSNADFRLTERIQEGFKGLGIELEHIIIDTYKEQYTVLKQGDTFESFQREKEATGEEKPYKVEKMDSNKVLSKPIGRVFEPKDVVEKIQQMRFSALPKKGIIILNSANDIIANIMVDNFEYKTIIDAMIDTPTATSIIAYSNTETEKAVIKDLRNELPLLEVALLDFIQTSSNTEGIIDYYKSWESEGFLGEVQTKYGTNSVMESTVNDDSVTKIVKQARAQGFSEAAIKTFLEKNNFSEAQIADAMTTETPASARVKISEQLTEGFDRMMGEVEGIIEKSKKRNVDQAKITENVLNYVMGSKVYENATDVQREKIIRDIKTKFGIRLKSAPSVEKLFGTIKDIKKFTLTEKQLYIKRLKDLQEGAKTAVAATKQAAMLMAQEIKALVKSGTITTRQAGFIISKFSKVNMLSPTSVSRFVDYMGKVFADAEYGAQLKTASGLKSDIKKLAKNKDKNADFRKLAEEFIKIDPSMVDDIYAYNKMASEIKSSVKGSSLRGAKVGFTDVVSIQDATRYISDTLRVQDKKILEEQRAEVQELMDIDASEMTPEQLRDLLEGEGKVTKYNESIVRSLLDKAFKAYSGVIDEILKTGYDAFYTGEKVELSKNQKSLIKQFMNMDLTVLTPKESLQAVDALANFIQNQSTAKMETIVSDYTGRLNARKLAESKVKAQPLMKYKSKGFGKFLAEQTTTLPILFEKMFKGFNRSGKVMDMMGVTKLINGKSLAQNQSNMIVNDYVRQFFNKKANGEAFNTESNNVERGMASFMMRNVIGTEQEMKDEFNRRKNLLKESIEVLSKGNDVEKQKAALYQKAYDKIVKESNTIQEVKSKTDATNLEAIEFWTSQWADKYEELSDVSENVYNKILDKDINYTPDRFARISSDTGEVDLANDESAFHNNNGTIYKKETGVLMKATKPETLPTNKKNGKPTSYIELSFDKNNSNSMYDALVDMKTASAIRQIEAFENSADFEKIVPTADDAKILKDRVQLYVRNIRNKNPYSDDQFSKAVRSLNRLAAFGVGQALSGFAQPIKQMVPVLTNTLINAGSIDIMSGFDAVKQKFMSESGYAIANRGVESQAQIESLNKLIDSAPTGNFDKAIKRIEKINQGYLQFFLVNPDVFIARASWMSYYEKSLKKQGIDPNGVDYNTHELNEEAANYAQRMVDRQQNISDVDLSGKLFASKESANQVLVKMLMPFASFRMNQSARLGADLATLADKTATAEDKTIAKKSLAGFGVELATFKIISAGIAITLGTLTKALMGQDEDEEEKDKRINNVIKGQWTGTVTDIISPLPIVDKPIQAAVETVSTLLEEGTGLPLSTFGVSKSDWTSNLGTFGISAQRATELYDMTKLATTGKYTDDFNKEHTISEESQSQITKLIPFAMLSNMGLAPSEVNTVVKNAVKYAKKNTKSPEEKQQAKENKEERESTKQEKINALETIIEESNDEAIINQAKDKIDELDADSEEKKIIKQENAEEKKEKKKLLVDPNTGEEYDTETDLKRYNRDLWEQNFGEGSDWYESHKEEKEMESLLRKKVQQMKDEEMNYTGRNSDGSKKRFGASGTKKTQRFGSSSKGKVKRFGS